MSESSSLRESGLFDSAQVWLFGKEFPAITYAGDPADAPAADGRQGASHSHMGTQTPAAPDWRFARIYAFSFEGHYYKLPRPMVFLVHGKGDAAQNDHGQFEASKTGIESKGFRFASDIRVWKMDRLQATVCMDVEAGRLDELLLAPAAATEEGASGRSAVAGRSAAAGRSAMAARSAAAFRSAMIGPHQD